MRETLQTRMTLKLLETLNESQTRWFIAREAMRMGYGGIKKMCDLTGLSKPTVIKGMKELKSRKKLCIDDRICKIRRHLTTYSGNILPVK